MIGICYSGVWTDFPDETTRQVSTKDGIKKRQTETMNLNYNHNFSDLSVFTNELVGNIPLLKGNIILEMSEQDSYAILKNIISVKQLFTIFCDF